MTKRRKLLQEPFWPHIQLYLGIAKEDLDEFLEKLSDKLGLDNEQWDALTATLNPMKFTQRKEFPLFEMSFNIKEVSSIYGYINCHLHLLPLTLSCMTFQNYNSVWGGGHTTSEKHPGKWYFLGHKNAISMRRS